MERCADLLGEIARLGGILVRHRDEAHRRVSGREAGAQAADAAGADDRESDVLALHDWRT
jgi:hypothetical protein